MYFFLFFIGGCAPSIIKLNYINDNNPISQFSKSSNRNFIYEPLISDSVVEKWEAEINGGFSNSSVTVSDSAVFVNDLSGRVYCFSLATGKTLGQLKYKGSIFTAPIIHKSVIYFVVISDKEEVSTLYTYDIKNGKEISATEMEGRITSQLVIIDGAIYALTEKGKLYQFSLAGEHLWTFDTKSDCHDSPALISTVIVLGNDNGEIISIGNENIQPSDAMNSRLNYRRKIGGPFFSSPVISGNEIFIGNDDGNLYSVDLNSGNVNWAFQTSAKIRMETIVTQDEIFIGNLKGELYKLSRGGKQIWKLETKGLLNITPLLTNDYLILPDANKKVYFISRNKGEIFHTLELDGRMKLSPVIKGNFLFIGYENGNLKAYEFVQ